jgi:hypothetical protein
VTWEWLKELAWIGTTVVAIGGLGATVWTARRSGQVQITLHDRQSAENRRILEWQERRTAYAALLKDFQEYFDKVTTQHQLDWAVSKAGNMALIGEDPDLSALWEQLETEEERQVALQVAQQRAKEQFDVLTRREVWAIETTVATAANHARLIAPPTVRHAIAILMETSATIKLQEASKQGLEGFEEFISIVQRQKLVVEQLMNEDLTKAAGTGALR